MQSGQSSTRWGLVVAAGLVIFMAQLDVTVVAVALPAIERDLGVVTTVSEWVALGYVVSLIALTLLSGRWLDTVSHRHALALGTLKFAAASVAAGLSPAIGPLIAARVVQGAFAALLVALAPVLAVGAAAPAARGACWASWRCSLRSEPPPDPSPAGSWSRPPAGPRSSSSTPDRARGRPAGLPRTAPACAAVGTEGRVGR